MTPEQVTAEVAARIKQSDEEAHLSAAAFSAGRETFEAYLKAQKRFSHLLPVDLWHEEVQQIQDIADRNIEKYGL